MKYRENQSGPTHRATRKPFAAGLCVVAASVLGVGVAAEAFGPTTQAGAMTSADAEVFVGIDPVRLLDTRSGVGAPAPGPFGPGQTRSLVAAGFEGVPTNATSIAINVTLPRSATSTSFVTVWPSGSTQPTTSTSNATPGQAVPNFAITALGAGGAIDVFNERGDTHIVIDVVGYYVPLPSSGAPAASGGALIMGVGAPADDMGDNGDFYIEQVEADMYEKADDTWGDPLIELATEADARTGPHVIAENGPPSASDGVDGDVYLDTSALEVYGPKAAGVWGSGQPIGPDGVGSSFLSGSAAPGNVGVDGDLYLDTTNAVLYGPKVGASWGAGQAVGPDGVGSTLLTGVGSPVGVGAEGDLYLDTAALELHGPKTSAGWPVPTTLLNPGVDLQVGIGGPDDLAGVEGDVYIDKTTLLVYGPKPSDTSWGTGVDLAGPPTAASDSAVGATVTNTSLVAVSLSIGERPIPFPNNIIDVGTALTWTDTDTVTVNTKGTYKVSYALDALNLALFGGVELQINGNPVDAYNLITVGGSADGVRLFEANPNDTIELVATGLTLTALRISGSIVIELIAVS